MDKLLYIDGTRPLRNRPYSATKHNTYAFSKGRVVAIQSLSSSFLKQLTRVDSYSEIFIEDSVLRFVTINNSRDAYRGANFERLNAGQLDILTLHCSIDFGHNWLIYTSCKSYRISLDQYIKILLPGCLKYRKGR